MTITQTYLDRFVRKSSGVLTGSGAIVEGVSTSDDAPEPGTEIGVVLISTETGRGCERNLRACAELEPVRGLPQLGCERRAKREEDEG